MSLALSTCLVFTSLMQLVNGVEYLNITFLVILSEGSAVPAFLTIMFPLASIYVSL